VAATIRKVVFGWDFTGDVQGITGDQEGDRGRRKIWVFLFRPELNWGCQGPRRVKTEINNGKRNQERKKERKLGRVTAEKEKGSFFLIRHRGLSIIKTSEK